MQQYWWDSRTVSVPWLVSHVHLWQKSWFHVDHVDGKRCFCLQALYTSPVSPSTLFMHPVNCKTGLNQKMRKNLGSTTMSVKTVSFFLFTIIVITDEYRFQLLNIQYHFSLLTIILDTVAGGDYGTANSEQGQSSLIPDYDKIWNGSIYWSCTSFVRIHFLDSFLSKIIFVDSTSTTNPNEVKNRYELTTSDSKQHNVNNNYEEWWSRSINDNIFTHRYFWKTVARKYERHSIEKAFTDK